jgi:hypothetical protein
MEMTMFKILLSATAATALTLASAVSALAQTAPTPPPADSTVTPPASDTPTAPVPQDAGPPPSHPATDIGPNGAAPPGLAVGVAVKDNTGAEIGKITEVKPDGTGRLFATITMTTSDAFAVDASSLAMRDGAAVINMTQDQIMASIKKPAAGTTGA